MGIASPQVVTEDRASGALVIDRSLKFDDAKKHYLKQTIGNGTNGFTISCWMKPCQTGNRDEIFDTVASPGFYLYRHTDGSIRVNNDSVNLFISNGLYRDTTEFYNIVFSYDSTSGYGSLYVNGRLDKTAAFTTQLYAGTAKISSEASNDPANYYLGQWYLIDGQALGPGYFGYTDPLTNTWRPKKFKAEGTTVNDGTRWRTYLSASNGSFHADPYGADAAFNGTVGSGSGGYCQAANGSANPNSITFDVSAIGGIPFKNSVEVWLINNANTVTVNGGEAQSIAGTTFVTVARGPGVLNTIVFERPSTNGASLGTIRVDGVNLRDDLTQYVQFGAEGFYLPMDGNTPIGKNQAPSINDGTVWSDSLTSTQNFNLAVTRAFDGDTSTLAATANATNANILWTQTVTNVKTLRIYMDHDYQNYRVRVNGGSWHDDDTLGATQNSDWRDLTSLIPSNGIITSIESDTGGLNNGVNWSAVEINGDILIDSTTEKGNDWTPVNFGGSNSIEKATGALPILDTQRGGNVAKVAARGASVSNEFTVTTGTYDSATRYELDGVDRPAPRLYRGGTYTFDYTAVSGHPLYLSSLPDGKHNSKAYSVSFDGTGDALRVADHEDLRFGTGAFTIECYVWFNSFDDNYPSVISKYTGNTASWILRVRNTGKAVFYTAVGGGTNNESSRSVISLNKWHHIAMVREGTGSNQSKMYVDGKLVVTCTDGTDYTDTQEVTLGAQNASDSNVLNGYLSNVRIIKGTALYTTEFTPPTTTLTNITNTKLLCCQDSDELTAAVIPSGSITKAGNPDATNSHNPFLYNNVHGNFGVNTSTTNVTKITIPHYAADVLYYYCNQHSGMGNTTAMSVVTDLEKADPHAWKCILAVPMLYSPQNAKFDFSGDINCTTTNDTTITNNSVDFNKEQSIFYNESADVTGSEYLSAVDLSTWNTEKPWTVEFWWYRTGANQNDHGHFIGGTIGGTNQYGPTYRDGSHNDWQFNFKGQSIVITPSPALQTNKWEHHAFTSNGSNISYFRDGVFQTAAGAASMEGTWGNSNEIFRGGAGWTSQYVKGHVCDMRVYAGVEKYTTDGFIPASTNPDILLDTPSGLPVKTQLAKVPAADGGSIAFGSAQSDYLYLDDDADTRLTNTFSIEFFYNEASSRTAGAFITDGGGNSNPVANGTTNGISYQFYHNAGTIYLNWSNGSGTWYNINNVVMPSSSAWHHVLVTNDNSRTRMFIDGVLVGQHSEHDWGVASSSRKVYIGTMSAGPGTNTQGSYNSHGYMSNFRMCNGSVPTDYATTETTTGVQVFTPPKGVLTTTSQGATANDVKLLFAKSQTQPGSAVVAPTVTGVNDGTQWSAGAGPNFESVNPAPDGFNGLENSNTRTDNANVTATVTLPKEVPFTTSLKVRGARDSGNGTIKLTGGNGEIDVSSQFTSSSSSLETVTITGVTSPLKAISLTGIQGSAQPRFSAIYIDDVMLVDPIKPKGNVYGSSVNPFTDDINTVRGRESGYCTINPLSNSSLSVSNGNLTYDRAGNADWESRTGTLPMTAGGKWYFEVFLDNAQTGNNNAIVEFGFATRNFTQYANYLGTDTESWAYQNNGSTYGQAFHNNSQITNYGSNAVTGDTLALSLDLSQGGSNGVLTFYKNGVSMGTAYSNIDCTRDYFPAFSAYNAGKATCNFGQKPFKFPPPDGFQPINAANVLPETVIIRPDQYFEAVTYTGNGTAQNLGGSSPSQNATVVGGTITNPRFAFNGSSANWANLTADTTSTAAHVDFAVNLTGITRIEAAFDSPSGSGDTRGRYNGANAGNTRTGTGSGYSDIYNGSAITVTSVGFGINQNGQTGTNNDVVSRFRITDSQGTRFIVDRTAEGLRFKPDFVWIKQRSTPDQNHALFDSIRGSGHNLSSSTDHAERSDHSGTTGDLTSFDANGFSLGSSAASGARPVNLDGKDIIAWCWRAGGKDGSNAFNVDGVGYATFAASGTTAGTITPTGTSIGTKQGFSIIKYPGTDTGSSQTIPHGLNEPPVFWMYKNITQSSDWIVYTTAIDGSSDYLKLNGTDVANSGVSPWSTLPTNSVVTVGTNNVDTCNDGDNFIMYAWHNVPGLQKFGKYTGNQNADGTFVELGFRPALVWLKETGNAGYWNIYDNKRNPSNLTDRILWANDDYEENDTDIIGSSGSNAIDFLSNGFKLRSNKTGTNRNGGTYLYCAWAEAPASNLYGATSNAR